MDVPFCFPKTYTQDANGNTTSDGTFTFTYDALNRLIQVEKQGTTVATYGYDSSNRRIRKTMGATTTHYLYDLDSHLIAETLADGTMLREYIYLDNEPLALKEYQTNPGTYYFVNDHLGTPQQLVTATGTIVWQASYDPYGQAQPQVETVKNNLRFPGQYFDVETGLHYNWHRYYDPSTGRYLTPDPIGIDGGINLYGYVQNNPVNLIDPTGLEWQFAFGVSGTVGGMIPPFILGPSGFGGGGMVVGFNSNGQLFVQSQANLMAGAGTFVGVGFVGGITHSDCSMQSGLNTSESTYGEANAGGGIAGGAYGTRGDDGSLGVGGTPLPRLGFGYGAMAGAGRSTTTTYASRPLW